MKKWVLLGVGFLLFVAMVGAEEKSDYRAFTAIDGRVLEARIVDYEPRTWKAMLELRNGRKKSVNISVFSEADRPQFYDWFILNETLSPTKLVVKIVEREETEGPYAPGTKGWKVDSMITSDKVYEILLDNKSLYPVKDLLVEYRVFYESWCYESRALVELGGESFFDRGTSSRLGISDQLRDSIDLWKQGEISMGDFPAKKRVNQATTTSIVKRGHEERIDMLSGSLAVDRGRLVEGRFEGMLVRVSTPLSDGTRAGKVYGYPESFVKTKKVTWSDEPPNGPVLRDKSLKKAASKKAEEYARAMDGEGFDSERKRYASPELYFALQGWIFGYDEAPRRIGDLFMNGAPGVECDEETALGWYEIGAKGKDLNALVKLAWYYGGSKDKKKRDAEKAEKAADRLMKLKPKDPDHKAAAAAAYAEAKRFQDAVRIQQEVVDESDKEVYRASLKRYEQKLKYEAH